MNKCLDCKKSVKNKYCNNSCQQKYQSGLKIQAWLDGTWDGMKGTGDGTTLAPTIRNYLLAKVEYKCTECGWGKVNPYSGKVPLEVDHINGNWQDNSPDNLKVLCPNCHALTSTHKGMNRNKGHKQRKYSGNRGSYWKNEGR